MPCSLPTKQTGQWVMRSTWVCTTLTRQRSVCLWTLAWHSTPSYRGYIFNSIIQSILCSHVTTIPVWFGLATKQNHRLQKIISRENDRDQPALHAGLVQLLGEETGRKITVAPSDQTKVNYTFEYLYCIVVK